MHGGEHESAYLTVTYRIFPRELFGGVLETRGRIFRRRPQATALDKYTFSIKYSNAVSAFSV